jgi:hypothetical protein
MGESLGELRTRKVRACKTAGKRTFTAVIERDSVTGLLVGYVPGFRGAHSQAETLEELNESWI